MLLYFTTNFYFLIASLVCSYPRRVQNLQTKKPSNDPVSAERM